MHSIVRYYIRTSLIFLFSGLLLGGYFMIETYWLNGDYPPEWVSAHTHIILLGFVMMMILGVAQWMFPRPTKDDRHYSPQRALIIFYLYSGSTAFRFISEILTKWVDQPFVHHGIVIFSLIQIAAILLFFYNMRTRIRATGSKLREQKGERF